MMRVAKAAFASGSGLEPAGSQQSSVLWYTSAVNAYPMLPLPKSAFRLRSGGASVGGLHASSAVFIPLDKCRSKAIYLRAILPSLVDLKQLLR